MTSGQYVAMCVIGAVALIALIEARNAVLQMNSLIRASSGQSAGPLNT